MRIILNCFRFIWKVFWRLVWAVVLAFMILVSVLYFTNPSQNGFPGISKAFQTAVNQVDTFLNQQGIHTGLSQNVQNLGEHLTDEHIVNSDGARWETASATVYIETDNPTFRAAYQEAIASWNATGVFTFQLVEDKSQANIIATEMNDSSITAAGEAESKTNVLTNRYTSVTVRLNAYYLLNRQYGYSHERIVNTAAHELGHAIGLDHNESESVMQSAGSFYSIQPVDIQDVKELYQD